MKMCPDCEGSGADNCMRCAGTGSIAVCDLCGSEWADNHTPCPCAEAPVERALFDTALAERNTFKDVVVKDTHDNTVTIRESSAVCTMGPAGSFDGPFVWVFTKDNQGQQAIEHMGQLQSRSPHLTPKQARAVARALNKFADTYEPKRKR